MGTTACLFVMDDQAMAWLADRPVVQRCWEQLQRVRGIDNMLCCARKDLLADVHTMLPADVDIHTLPRAVDDLWSSMEAADRWLCGPQGPAVGSEVLVLLRAVTPFLPAIRIEACLRQVRLGRGDSAVMVRKLNAWVMGKDGKPACRPVTAAIDVCRVFSSTITPRQRAPVNKHCEVTVSQIEALNISEPEDAYVAQALVLCGDV